MQGLQSGSEGELRKNTSARFCTSDLGIPQPAAPRSPCVAARRGADGKPVMFPRISDDHRIGLFLLLVVVFTGLFWWWNRRARRWLEERGRAKESPNAAERLTGGLRQRAARLRYSEQEFQEMVANALDEVPEEFDKEWKNVAVLVSTDWPSAEDRKRLEMSDKDLLLGTYSGVARTEGVSSRSAPHIIVIYQPAIERACGGDKKRIQREIRKTVLHELAHHLGMSHERMRKIGL